LYIAKKRLRISATLWRVENWSADMQVSSSQYYPFESYVLSRKHANSQEFCEGRTHFAIDGTFEQSMLSSKLFQAWRPTYYSPKVRINHDWLVRNIFCDIQVSTKLDHFCTAQLPNLITGQVAEIHTIFLTKSVGKRKAGAKICKFQPLIMLRSKVTWFRIHPHILLKSSGEEAFCKQRNFRTEHDGNINLHVWAPPFYSPKVPIIVVWLFRNCFGNIQVATKLCDGCSARLRSRNTGQPVEIHTNTATLLCWQTESWCKDLQVSTSHHVSFKSYVVSHILKSSGEVALCKQRNFRTEHDGNVNLHVWAPPFYSAKVLTTDVWLFRNRFCVLSLLFQASPECSSRRLSKCKNSAQRERLTKPLALPNPNFVRSFRLARSESAIQGQIWINSHLSFLSRCWIWKGEGDTEDSKQYCSERNEPLFSTNIDFPV
jgi:hypothetical protein